MHIPKFSQAPQNPSTSTKIPAGIRLATPGVHNFKRDPCGTMCMATVSRPF